MKWGKKRQGAAKHALPIWLRNLLAVGVLVSGAAYLVVIFFTVTVCNDQIASNGNVGRVCRHVELTDVLVAPVGVLMVVALSTFFAEISWFGITLKRRLEKVEAEASDARREARDALLAAKYNSIRAGFRAGPERDAGMQRVWLEMTEQLRDEPDFDLAEHLRSGDDGLRLAGYAYLLSHPEDRWIPELVKIIDADRANFNQEMGLRTLKTLLRGKCRLLTDELRSELKRLEQEWQREHKDRSESKRAQEVKGILKQCPG
jgi:hypothetical protein